MNNTITPFSQVCVWRNIIVKDHEIPDLEACFKKNFNTRIKYIKSINLPNDATHVLFYVHNEDIPTFAIQRLRFNGSISWLEDAIANEPNLYPQDVKDLNIW